MIGHLCFTYHVYEASRGNHRCAKPEGWWISWDFVSLETETSQRPVDLAFVDYKTMSLHCFRWFELVLRLNCDWPRVCLVYDASALRSKPFSSFSLILVEEMTVLPKPFTQPATRNSQPLTQRTLPWDIAEEVLSLGYKLPQVNTKGYFFLGKFRGVNTTRELPTRLYTQWCTL